MGAIALITRRLPEPALEIVRSECRVEVFPHDRAMTRAELFDAIGDKDGILCLLTDQIDSRLIEAAPRLRVIANYAVGYDNVDVAAATARKIPVTNTPDVLTETTADLTWALLMAVARRIPEADRFVRAGRFDGWGPTLLLGTDIYGKTLGVVGMGRIGQAVAKRSVGFGMRVLYTDPRPLAQEAERVLAAERVSLERLLRESDFVTLHVPLTKDTYHLVGAEQFRLMKPTAYLINTARGSVIDEKALVSALRSRRIAGAGLDVFEREPHIAPELLDLENVVVLPHIGSASKETRTRMAVMAAENLVAGLRGENPPNCVNPEVFGT